MVRNNQAEICSERRDESNDAAQQTMDGADFPEIEQVFVEALYRAFDLGEEAVTARACTSFVLLARVSVEACVDQGSTALLDTRNAEKLTLRWPRDSFTSRRRLPLGPFPAVRRVKRISSCQHFSVDVSQPIL
jgi:hypothetical protein